MEKISNIVRGNSRVTSADVKSSSAVRPGALSFGRTVGESPAGPEKQEGSTASRANTIHSQMAEQRRSSNDRIVEQMADQFFMSRIRRPVDSAAVVEGETGGSVAAPEEHTEIENGGGARAMASLESDEVSAPVGYKPRGSYVNVRA